MVGAIPPLPNTPSRSGAQLKHGDNFTFTFTFTFTGVHCILHVFIRWILRSNPEFIGVLLSRSGRI
jgi:hypothetical protein